MPRIKQAIDAAYDRFIQNDVPSPRLNAELLLMFVLNCDRAYLFAHPERELGQSEQYRYEEVIGERQRGCPTQYITGHQEFWGLDFIVSPAVLIPRPETEHVIETVLDLVKQSSPEERIRLVDVGSGSGCIALSLAKELPQAEIHACDISEPALEIARANAARLGLAASVQFSVSDLLSTYRSSAFAEPAQKKQFDFVVSNPPYVGESEADKVQKQVRDFEPKLAVFSGWEGTDIYKRLVPEAWEALKPGGWLVVEIGYSIEEKVKALLSGWTQIRTTFDLQGIPRVVAARKPG
ncbi:MAG TPA: peptide chain release factor N(5)-glutamine methyltransferase [Candidatus Angelobacter sp.]|nr:peptide chain release factor N(5)-glutamine methyltransferase [Candidatus Angelobacter sp.]